MAPTSSWVVSKLPKGPAGLVWERWPGPWMPGRLEGALAVQSELLGVAWDGWAEVLLFEDHDVGWGVCLQQAFRDSQSSSLGQSGLGRKSEKEPKPGLVVGRPGEDQHEGRLGMTLHGRKGSGGTGPGLGDRGGFRGSDRGPRRLKRGGGLAGGPQDVSR